MALQGKALIYSHMKHLVTDRVLRDVLHQVWSGMSDHYTALEGDVLM